MVFDLTILVALIVSFGLFLSKGPGKLVSFTLMCFSDNVNLLNLTCALGAFTLKALAKTSQFAELLTPIVIFVSAIIVLLYNVAKFSKLNRKNDDEENF